MKNSNVISQHPRSCYKAESVVHPICSNSTPTTQLPLIHAELRASTNCLRKRDINAVEEAERRWPGIVVLTERHLDDQLGVAVYFTFPGGKHMAVWFSMADELGVVSEDRSCWRSFLSQHERRFTKRAA